MASYLPPLENLPIFNDELFTDGEDLVTIEYANKHYLRFPNAQGTETLQAIIVNGPSQFNANINVGSSTISQSGNTTPNTLGLTNISTSFGQSGTNSLTIRDTVGNQGFAFLPNANTTSYNPAVGAGDTAMVSTGTLPGTDNMAISTWGSQYCGLKLTASGSASLGAGGVTPIPRTRVSLDGTDITIASNLSSNTTGKILLNSFGVVNNSSYTQSVQGNTTNPTTISASTTECFIISSAANSVVMDTFANYLKSANGGWTCKIANTTSTTINITTPDANFLSWLHPTPTVFYDIQPYNSIQVTALPLAVSGLGYDVFIVEDHSGYRTFNTTNNVTHYLNFSDGFGTGVGNIQKTAGISCNPSTNTITATNFTGTALSATRITTTSDNTNGTYFIPFVKTTAGPDTNVFIDDVTGPLTYNPSSSALTFLTGQCARYDSAGASSSSTLFGNVGTGNVTIANALTTGSLSLGSTAMTTGSINIGSTTASATGLVNIRPVLTLARQLRTTNSVTYPPTNVLDLGYSVTVTSGSFANTTLAAGIVTNVYSVSFTSANFGTYMFIAQILIDPDNTTAIRRCEMSISTTLSQIQDPYKVQNYTAVGGTLCSQNLTRIIPIYAATTITLTALCSSSANIIVGANEGLFQYTRIA